MVESISAFKAVVAPMKQAIRCCDPSRLSAAELGCAVGEVRELQGLVEAFLLRIAKRSNELAVGGMGSGARELMLGDGEVSARQARVDAARADVAATLPAVAGAVADGRVGSGHVDAMAVAMRGLGEVERGAVVEQEALIVDAAASQPVDTFNTWMKRRVNIIREDWGHKQSETQQAASEFRHWRDTDGMGHFRGKLDPQRFDCFVGAIDAQMRSMLNHSADSAEVADGVAKKVHANANLAAAALVELVSGGNGRHGRADIKLVVDADTLLYGPHDETVCETSAGSPVPLKTVDRFACAADIQRVVLDPANVEVRVGRKHRTATDAQWSALIALYASCGWFGCDRPVDWCQAHHVQTWEDLGDTDLDNLLPLCSQHHHAVHEGRWRVELDPDRTVRLYTPDGQHWRTTKPDRLTHWLAAKQATDPPCDKPKPGSADEGPGPDQGTSPPTQRPRGTS